MFWGSDRVISDGGRFPSSPGLLPSWVRSWKMVIFFDVQIVQQWVVFPMFSMAVGWGFSSKPLMDAIGRPGAKKITPLARIKSKDWVILTVTMSYWQLLTFWTCLSHTFSFQWSKGPHYFLNLLTLNILEMLPPFQWWNTGAGDSEWLGPPEAEQPWWKWWSLMRCRFRALGPRPQPCDEVIAGF
jgi:hypothetical protein